MHRELRAAHQLINQGFKAFVPCCWKNRRHSRRLDTVLSPLFPRYIFTVADRTQCRWRSINGTLGVERLLMCGGEPQPVPPGFVESLLLATDSDGCVRFDFDLKPGQIVKVTTGPFASLVGKLEKLDENGRVGVLLELMGAAVRVDLPACQIAPY